MIINEDYAERVYAGVLGKIIGVYLGRPCEGWTYKRIMREVGEIRYYVNEKFNLPLVLADDDICGTLTFLRAITDNNYSLEITPDQIGDTLLNYLIENRTIFWWGGLGNSTEHTAYLRLKNGIRAPMSGSIKLNGKIVAEQIGAQIFIDGWALISPGDPVLAAYLAKKAASVTHDGEAIYAAQVIAAMEACAFIESDINKLINTAVQFIPKNSVIYQMINDIREWYIREKNWRKTRKFIENNYGYDKYPGGCHIVPNHGLIILSLLYGKGDFQKSLMIVNTSGWDTDCNSGNVGCILGIKNGLKCFNSGIDWRGPVRDRIYLPTADSGSTITDAVIETFRIINICYEINGKEKITPKGGARFNFDLPGSIQGFQIEDISNSAGTTIIENIEGQSQKGNRSLAIKYHFSNPKQIVRVKTATFIPPEEINEFHHYPLIASPTLCPGQTIRAGVSADYKNDYAIKCILYINIYSENDHLLSIKGPLVELKPGNYREIIWQVCETGGLPIAEVGLEIKSNNANYGEIYLDYLTFDGSPNIVLTRPSINSSAWHKAWVNGVDKFIVDSPQSYRIVQNYGVGLLMYGTRDWKDYRVITTITPYLTKSFGIGIRVQGMSRYYALLLCDDNKARLIKFLYKIELKSEIEFLCEFGKAYMFDIRVKDNHFEAMINGQRLFNFDDNEKVLTEGGMALVCEEGCISTDKVIVKPN